MAERFTFLDVFESEQSNLMNRLNGFERIGITDLFDRMLGLLLGLLEEARLYSSSAEYIPAKGHKATKTVSGTHIPNWNIRLFMHMLCSSLSQFVFATSHIFKGQALESYGHARRAIEGAGITYLSLSEPDIGELYGTADERKWRKRIQTDKILPPNDPLTSELNSIIRRASSQLHSNLSSISRSIIEEDFAKKDGGVAYTYVFSLTDDMSVEQVWETSFYILTAAYYVARLYAKSFNLPESEWHKQLEDYKSDVERKNLNLRNNFNQHPPS